MNIWIFNPYEPLPFEPASPARLRWSEGAVRLRYASLAEQLVSGGHSVTCPPSQSYDVMQWSTG